MKEYELQICIYWSLFLSMLYISYYSYRKSSSDISEYMLSSGSLGPAVCSYSFCWGFGHEWIRFLLMKRDSRGFVYVSEDF